ncbi:glycosyltransferase family 25 protein [Ahrensia sp. 13_GOM-1096m]|uniref:glycosyltransferase family 25 protein n=1 Tax=Ahrensia sp. 13_GOM-1096m TaxID=1380380 RepID=UPI0006851160|nr:glycosyltransferase family 25 protein [Ahrensia sp. 13_GOM-1096m]
MTSKHIDLPAKINAAYILHLKRSTQRAAQVEKLQALLGNKAHVFDAVDSQKMTMEQRAQFYIQKLQKPYYPFELSDNEIACFLSHRAIWAKIIDDNHDYALVVEDDVDLNVTTFQNALNLFEKAPEQNGFFRFPEEKKPPSDLLRATCKSAIKIGLGMQAQIISLQAAKKLLEATEKIDRPVDTTLQMQWIHGVPFLEIYPSGVTEIDQDLGGTTIQRRNKTLSENVVRAVLRAKYRSHIKIKSTLSHLRKSSV